MKCSTTPAVCSTSRVPTTLLERTTYLVEIGKKLSEHPANSYLPPWKQIREGYAIFEDGHGHTYRARLTEAEYASVSALVGLRDLKVRIRIEVVS